MSTQKHWTTLRQRKISRRTMLGASAKAGVGVAGLALVGCGDDDDAAAAGTAAAERAASAAEEAAAAAIAAGEARAAETEAAADAAAEAAAAASEASAAASQAADAADAAAALAAQAAESEDAANAAAAAEAAAAAAADAAAAASAAGDQAAAAVAAAASEAAEAAAQAARDAAAAVEAGTATAAAAQAAIDEAAEAAAAAAAAAGEASAAAGAAAATAQETAEAAAETAAAAVAAAQEAADAAQEAAESAAMAAEEDEAPAAATGPRRGGIARAYNTQAIEGWDPAINTHGGAHFWFLNRVFDRLLDYDSNGNAIPMLADSWEIPDPVTYNLHMRGALFHDGSVVDAEAVRLNMERIQEISPTSIKSGLASADSLEAVSASTFRLVNSEPFAPTLAGFFGRPAAGMMISPANFDDASTNPVGAGPFKFDRNIDNDVFESSRFDDYWNAENIWLDGWHAFTVPDENSGFAAFQAGEFDMGKPIGYALPTDQVADLEADGFQVLTGLYQTWVNNWYNMDPAQESPMGDVRVRKAHTAAIQREQLRKVGFHESGAVSRGIGAVQAWYHEGGRDFYENSYDPAEGRKLLDAAGYGDGVDLTMITFSFQPQPRMAEALQAQNREIGINFEVIAEEIPVSVERLFSGGQSGPWDMAFYTWESPYDPDPVFRGIAENHRGYQIGYFGEEKADRSTALGAEANDLFDLMDAAARVPTPEERTPLYHKWFEAILENEWQSTYVQYSNVEMAPDYVKGLAWRDVDGILKDDAHTVWFDL